MTTADSQRAGSLVGRARELAELEQTLDRVESGTHWAIEIVGEPGIGKSRLIAELGRIAEARGYLVLDGRAAEFESDIPFGVIVDALNDYVGSLGPAVLRGLEAGVVQELALILPSLSTLSGEQVGPRAQTERYRVHYAIRALLELLAKRQPVLLAIDDVHWADAASFEVMAHLLRRFRGPMLAAFAFRYAPARLVGALEATARAGFGSRLELAPLSAAEAATLLDPDLDGATRDALYLESGGNPFYLEQLARGPTGRSPAASGRGERLGEAWEPPPGVVAAIDQELDRLSAGQRRTLDAAAVAGDSFDPLLVSAIAEQDEPTALAALDGLIEVGLVRPTAVPRSFRFRHPIVRRAVYDALPGGWRVGAHARAAAGLASIHASGSELAHHVARSASIGDEHAISLLIDAARATAARAPLTAGQWLLAAARLVPSGDYERRVRLLGEAGASLTSGGGFDDALTSLDEALSLAHPDSTGVRAGLIANRAEARRRGGRPFDSRGELERALESPAGPEGPTAIAARLELAMDRYWYADFAAVHEHAAQALVFAREDRDPLLICLSAALDSLASSSRNLADDAFAQFRDAQAAYAALPDEQLAERVYLCHYMSEAALRLERSDDALAHHRRGSEVARMTGQDATSHSWPGLAVYALLLKGELNEAARVAAGAINTADLARDDWKMIWVLAADALASLSTGQNERALASAREMITRAERSHPGTSLNGLARVQLAAALAAAGDPAGAHAELVGLDSEQSRWLLDLNCGQGWEVLIGARLAAGDVAAAGDAAATAESRVNSTRLQQRTAALRSARASVMLASGDAHAAAEAAEAAVQIAERTGNPVLTGRCLSQAGATLAAAGQRERGARQLERAERTLSACGAVREADAAARELRRLGRRVPRRARPNRGVGLAALSPREREVAEEVAAGKTNRDVAATLFLSEKTIESHLVRIYSKLDVHSRSALTAIVARQRGAADRAAGRHS
ncbi:MAG TPA: AAA family ATPase [Thermoleophilaceae bacterium]